MRKRARHPTIIEADPSHPDSWDNPANEEVWFNLARAIGRQIARDQRQGLIGPIAGDNEDRKTGSNLRALLKRHAKKDID